MDVTSSPESDTVEIQVKMPTPGAVSSPVHDDSNLINNDNDTGSTTEYVEILEDYTEPMFPETNIEVETSTGSGTTTTTPTTMKQVVIEAPPDSPKIVSTTKTVQPKKSQEEETPGPSEEKTTTTTTTSETKLFMCGVCKIILEKRYLANHMKKHLQQVNETHTCRICKETFSRKMLLSVHISQKHSIFTKDYVCQICKLPYDENNNDLHGGCHWFCNICSKTFMTKASMVCHSRMRHNRKLKSHVLVVLHRVLFSN